MPVPENWILLGIGGLIAGILAGFLGIGGGTILVPLLVALGITPIQAVATSNLSIVMTSIAGSIQNWRMGQLSPQRVMAIGLPAIATAQIGVWIASRIPDFALLSAFGVLLISNVYLVELRKQVTAQAKQREEESQLTQAVGDPSPQPFNPILARLATGGTAGVLAGLFGIGGGVIMVPLQILLLGETIKVAIQTSLGAIIITAVSALTGHALAGNVLVMEGILLGTGGLVGVQMSTRLLPKLSDDRVSLLFRSFLAILSLYIFWQAWQAYQLR